MEAGGSWCSTAIMVPSLKTALIRVTWGLHGPLKFIAFAQVFFFSCEDQWVLPPASLAGELRRSALRARLMAA